MSSADPTPRSADRWSWWRHGVVYQVYPRSFQDTNGDGVGDLEGVRRRLDHLVDLGVDAVWLSPFFRSPMADFGYDVSDHKAVDPLFGDMADFRRLLGEAHARGLKVILDYVPNHTSIEHPWFQASRQGRSGPKADWYVWADPAPGGGPPNNWLSEFGGPAWAWDETRRQYYYHAFLAEQPDLDWRNPAVVEAMLDVLRFWLEEGVDGFRVDAIHFLMEDEARRDDPPNPAWTPGMPEPERLLRTHTLDHPDTHAAVAAMRRVVDAYPGRVLIGEAYLPLDRLVTYYGEDLGGFHLPFNFHLIGAPWRPDAIAALVDEYERLLPDGAWPNWVLGNHDRSRVASRVGPDQARVAAMLLLTLRGTPTIYQGEELGMTDVPIPPDQVQDPWERNLPGLGLGRDPVRTPMMWDRSPNAGFSDARPWLPLSGDWRDRNVATQRAEPGSILNLHRALLDLRRREPAMHAGDYRRLACNPRLFAFERRLGDRRLVVALNFSPAPLGASGLAGEALLSTHGIPHAPSEDLVLHPNEGVVLAPR